jgi:hypothetical protein
MINSVVGETVLACIHDCISISDGIYASDACSQWQQQQHGLTQSQLVPQHQMQAACLQAPMQAAGRT